MTLIAPSRLKRSCCRWIAFRFDRHGATSDITELAQCYGLSLGRATERVSIVPATKDVAKHLGIAAGANVMKLDRIVETADGAPIEWRVAIRKI